jgi:hypothetical protein
MGTNIGMHTQQYLLLVVQLFAAHMQQQLQAQP